MIGWELSLQFGGSGGHRGLEMSPISSPVVTFNRLTHSLVFAVLQLVRDRRNWSSKNEALCTEVPSATNKTKTWSIGGRFMPSGQDTKQDLLYIYRGPQYMLTVTWQIREVMLVRDEVSCYLAGTRWGVMDGTTSRSESLVVSDWSISGMLSLREPNDNFSASRGSTTVGLPGLALESSSGTAYDTSDEGNAVGRAVWSSAVACKLTSGNVAMSTDIVRAWRCRLSGVYVDWMRWKARLGSCDLYQPIQVTRITYNTSRGLPRHCYSALQTTYTTQFADNNRQMLPVTCRIVVV